MLRRPLTLLLACLLSLPPAFSRDRHFTFWSDDARRFLDPIQSAPSAPAIDIPPGRRIYAGIVSHHFLANAMMVRFFRQLAAASSPKTVILLAPNHFHRGLANISFSSLPWKTPFGLLPSDRRFVRRLAAATGLPEDPDAFSGEHSVGVLIPFIHYYFPRSRIVPVLVDSAAEYGLLLRLRPILLSALRDPHTLLLLSMDFSHNSVLSIADSRDAISRGVISSLDDSRATRIEVDCRRGLFLFLRTLRAARASDVRITEHTNSARITGILSQPDVTSYFSVFFLGPD